jgi:transcription termination factor Rho
LDARTLDKEKLEGKLVAELQEIASSLGVAGHQKLKKGDLIEAIVDAAKDGQRASSADAEVKDAPAEEAASAGEAPAANENPGENPTRTENPTRVENPRPEAPSRPRETEDGDRDFRRGGRPPRRRRGRGGGGGGRGPMREREATEEELADAPVQNGILDVLPEGYGFLRTNGYAPSPQDVYVSLSQIRRFRLRRGDEIKGAVRFPKDNEKYLALLRIETVNQVHPDEARERPEFEKLTPLFPHDRFRLETDPKGVTERIIDLVAPVGKGQRGMVVSPPKAGKTTVLKQIANGIINSSPDTHVMVLLVDERPEEVTDWQRTVEAAEVVASTFDRPADQHIQITEVLLERAKRLVEMGRDVAIMLDSITRLARAYNLAAPASGRILSGGVDSTALYPPKRFFGAARNIEEGGSLTVVASALVETGSRMDEVIFEEFKGTGNMELRLDRTLSEKRIFPAINIEASGTRKEELLMEPEELALVWRLRRVLHALEPNAAMEMLIDKIRSTKSNEQFLQEIAKVPVRD